MHAYIIEDDYLISKSLQDMLEELGFTRFSFARSEDAAVLGANEPNIDLITADVRLLPGDGVKAVEAICASETSLWCSSPAIARSLKRANRTQRFWRNPSSPTNSLRRFARCWETRLSAWATPSP